MDAVSGPFDPFDAWAMVALCDPTRKKGRLTDDANCPARPAPHAPQEVQVLLVQVTSPATFRSLHCDRLTVVAVCTAVLQFRSIPAFLSHLTTDLWNAKTSYTTFM